MLGWLRTLLVLPLLLVTLIAVAIYARNGAVAPCRVLAAERVRQADLPPLARSGEATWQRFRTERMSSAACLRELAQLWGARVHRAWR